MKYASLFDAYVIPSDISARELPSYKVPRTSLYLLTISIYDLKNAIVAIM
jgi:hypothetical protein